MEKITDSLTNIVSGYYLNYKNHEMNNSILESYVRFFVEEVINQRINPIGIQLDIPFGHYENQNGEIKEIAFVFTEENDDEIKWIHLPVCVWEGYLEELYPKRWEEISNNITKTKK